MSLSFTRQFIQRALFLLSLLLTGVLLMARESDDEFLNNGGNNSTDNPTRFYATLMIEYEEPAFIDELQKTIAPEDLYIDETNYYFGLESEYHVTLLSFLENDVDVRQLKTYLKDISEYETQLVDVSSFPGEVRDVLKCSVESDAVAETSQAIRSNFINAYPYPTMLYHLTVAFLKPGCAQKYLQNQIEPVTIKPTNFLLSYYNKEGERLQIRFK
jgi:hypothetical protein